MRWDCDGRFKAVKHYLTCNHHVAHHHPSSVLATTAGDEPIAKLSPSHLCTIFSRKLELKTLITGRRYRATAAQPRESRAAQSTEHRHKTLVSPGSGTDMRERPLLHACSCDCNPSRLAAFGTSGRARRPQAGAGLPRLVLLRKLESRTATSASRLSRYASMGHGTTAWPAQRPL